MECLVIIRMTAFLGDGLLVGFGVVGRSVGRFPFGVMGRSVGRLPFGVDLDSFGVGGCTGSGVCVRLTVNGVGDRFPEAATFVAGFGVVGRWGGDREERRAPLRFACMVDISLALSVRLFCFFARHLFFNFPAHFDRYG